MIGTFTFSPAPMSPMLTGAVVINDGLPEPATTLIAIAEIFTPTAVPMPLFVTARVQTRSAPPSGPFAFEAMATLRAGDDCAKLAPTDFGPLIVSVVDADVPVASPFHCENT